MSEAPFTPPFREDVPWPGAATVRSPSSSVPSFSLPLAAFLAQEIAPLHWVVPGLIPAGGLVLLAGPQKTGKTTFAMDLAVAVAAGQPVLDRRVLAGPTLYVLEEGTPAGVADRYRRIVARRGAPADAHVVLRAGIRVDDAGRWRGLHDEIERLGITLVVVDPLVKLHPADENVAGQMSRVMTALQALTRSGAAVLVVHHTVKHAAEGGSIGNAARGSGAIISSTDGNLVLSREGDHLRLETEMRDAESESLRFSFDGPTASFALRAAATPAPAATRYPGGIDPDTAVSLAAAGAAASPVGGLTATELAANRGVSDETARQALSALVRDGRLVKDGPANRPVYRPADPSLQPNPEAA